MANIQVTHDSDLNNARSESSLVINPNNPKQIVAGSKKFNNIHNYDFTIATSFSTDGGLTWSPYAAPFELLPGWTGLTDPALAWDDSDNVFLVALPFNNPPDIVGLGIAVYKSSDAGQTWSAPNLIHAGDDDKQWAAGDGNPRSPFRGSVYAAWDGPAGLCFARTLDHGDTWIGTGASPAGMAIASGFSSEVNVAADGTVYIIFRVYNDTVSYPYYEIQMVKSTDGGNTFEVAASPAKGIGFFNGKLPHGYFRVLTVPTACDFGSTIVVAWADNREGNLRIYYAASTDGGASWNTPRSGQPLLAGLHIDANMSHFHPQIVFMPNGVLGCAFYEFGPKPVKTRFGHLTKLSIDTRMALSFDNGASFSQLFTVTDQPWDPAVDAPWARGHADTTFIGDYFGLDASDSGFYPLWTDTRTGIQELFTSVVLGVALEIDFDPSIDVCQRSFVETTQQTFRVTNLNVFDDQSGLVFSWSVTGAVPDATDTPSLTLSALPAAGTTVTINVTVKNTKGFVAAGTLSFQTLANDFGAIAAELDCRVRQILHIARFLPPWVPIEKDGTLKEKLTRLEKELSQVAQEMTRVNTLIGQLREFENRGAVS